MIPLRVHDPRKNPVKINAARGLLARVSAVIRFECNPEGAGGGGGEDGGGGVATLSHLTLV